LEIWKHTGSDNVAVLDHDSLGSTCGSRRVHDASQVVGLGRDRLRRALLAHLDQLVEAYDLQMGVRLGESVDVLLLRVILGAVYDDLDVLGLLHRVDKLG
jgi:hypothetical protein